MEAMCGDDGSMMMRMPDDVCRVGDMCKDDLLDRSHSDRLTNTHWEVQKTPVAVKPSGIQSKFKK